MCFARVLIFIVAVSFPALAQEQIPKTTTSPLRMLKFTKIASPVGERILAIACTDDGVILAGTEGNGILRSTDGGASWQTTSLREGNIWPIHVSPGGTLYAFTTDGWMSHRAVFTSSDGGANWTELPDSSARYFGMAIVKSYNSKMYSEGGGGLHVSTDDGASWMTIQTEPPMERCSSDYRLEVLSDSVLFAMCYWGLFRSGDGGLSWNRIPTQHRSYSQLLRDPAGGVLVAAEDSSSLNSMDELIRVSYDGSVVETIGPGPFWGGIPVGILLENGEFLAGSIEKSATIMRSTDSGRTWVNTSGIRAAVSDFCQCPDGTVFAATHGGLYRSHDSGITWEDCPVGSTRRPVRHIFDDGGTTIYAGTGDAGLFKSDDACLSWESAGTGYCRIVDGFSVAPGHILIGVEHTQPWLIYGLYGEIFLDWWGWRRTLDLSWDSGQTWQQLGFRFDCLTHFRDSVVLLTDNAFNISTDGGNSWKSDSMLWGARDIKALQGGIFVLKKNDTLYFRKDGNTEWEFISTAERGWAIGGDDSRLLLLESGAIRRSTDGGMTWTSTVVEDIFYHDPKIVTLDDGSLYAVTGIGDVLLLSKDAGETWNRVVPDGETRRFVYCAYTDSKGRLLLGTDDGIYRSATAARGNSIVYTFHLGVPYPNPATSPVMIPYTLEESGYVRLTIHDISGRERGILREGFQGPGTYYQGLHHTHSTYYGGAGLYFINLSVNDNVQTQPLVFP
ncbi:MAG: T9SS type A sorting domain-containing protein [Bacteroidota bacterium]|jgi:photosystem II stability/assembly factor-like uncharacterized protein